MNTPTQNLVLKHAPDLRFMFGMIPDVEILDRAIEVAVDDAVYNAVEEATAPLYTEADVRERVAEKVEGIREKLDNLLDGFENSDDDAPLTASEAYAEVIAAINKFIGGEL